ncbi:MAG: hypothetical protein QOF58_5655 [Pseudonocardiales bacterium]|nr:hypothetical protein [Pseudonocardiales bacterium]
MAIDVPMPRRDDPAVPGSFKARTLEQHMHAMLFLLNYLAYVQDSEFEISRAHPRPAGAGTGVVRGDGYGWAAQCADELRNTRPSDAPGVVAAILVQDHKWCQQSGFDPTANFYLANATPLLDALCPAEHRDEAGVVLAKFWDEIVRHDQPSLTEAAVRFPIATVHVTAAMAAAVFAQQDAEQRLLNQLELTSKLERLLA